MKLGGAKELLKEDNGQGGVLFVDLYADDPAKETH